MPVQALPRSAFQTASEMCPVSLRLYPFFPETLPFSPVPLASWIPVPVQVLPRRVSRELSAARLAFHRLPFYPTPFRVLRAFCQSRFRAAAFRAACLRPCYENETPLLLFRSCRRRTRGFPFSLQIRLPCGGGCQIRSETRRPRAGAG